MPRVERRVVRVGGDDVTVRLVASPGRELRGTVLLPPLIGSSGLKQVGTFRELNRAGYRIVTLDYRGHGRSGGRFWIGGSIADTRAALDVALEATGGEPLLGIGGCYSAIPLVVCASERPSAFRGLALFNPVATLQALSTPRELWARYRAAGGANPLDLAGILAATNAELFPEIDKSREHFGILHYRDVRAWTCAAEYLLREPLRGRRVELPALVAYGRSDHLLRLADAAAERRYLERWRLHLPRLVARPHADVDHFWSGPSARTSAVARRWFESLALVPAPPVSASPGTPLAGTTSSVA